MRRTVFAEKESHKGEELPRKEIQWMRCGAGALNKVSFGTEISRCKTQIMSDML